MLVMPGSVSMLTQHSTDEFNLFLRQRLGFSIDPFQYEEASADPHLSHYVVGLTQSQTARGEHPALIYAPAGGGKTAMRMHTLHSCWSGRSALDPLPVSCIPTRADIEQDSNEESFWHFLSRSTAAALLLGLSYRPERFLALDSSDAEQLVGLWHTLLPGPFARYWRILSDSLDPASLVRRLDPTCQLPAQPDRSQLWDFCHRMQLYASAQMTAPSLELWTLMRELIRSRLAFGSIFLLLDGLDGFPSTFHEPRHAERWLLPFLVQLPNLARKKVYVKAFLADEMRPLIEDDMPVSSVAQARLDWTPELLVEMLRKRVEYASGGRLGSLDAVCEPGLRNVERDLVERLPAPVWPRSLMRYTRSVLQEWQRRTYHSPGPIKESDLDAASAPTFEDRRHVRSSCEPET